MVPFEAFSWDPVLRDIGQRERMTKRIFEYFKEGRTKKNSSEIQEKDVEPQTLSCPIHIFHRIGAVLPL